MTQVQHSFGKGKTQVPKISSQGESDEQLAETPEAEGVYAYISLNSKLAQLV